MDATDLRLRAQSGAAALHAKYGVFAPAEWARKGKFQRYLREVDPDEKLLKEERVRRAEALQRSKMIDLARRSRDIRSVRKQLKQQQLLIAAKKQQKLSD